MVNLVAVKVRFRRPQGLRLGVGTNTFIALNMNEFKSVVRGGWALVLGLMLGGAALPVWGQDEEAEINLVPNGSFEEADVKRLKAYGELVALCKPWLSPTAAQPDLYGTGMKSEKVNAPKNLYGVQEATDGSNYAGIRALSKDVKLPRTYLQIALSEKLEAGQMYCVSFDISFAENSRMACNDVGVVFSDRKLAQNNTGSIVRDVAVRHSTNKVLEFSEGWESICGTVIGTGTEAYLILGGFGSDAGTKTTKPKRPAGITGTQLNHAYYYVDNIRVYPVTAKSQCSCGQGNEARSSMVYGASIVLNDNMTDEEKLSVSAVYFGYLKRNATSAADETVALLATILKAHPSWKLTVVGYTDDDEFNEGKVNARYQGLGMQRAEFIREALIQQGIGADRLTVESRENADPASTRDTEISRAQNRRVTFTLVK